VRNKSDIKDVIFSRHAREQMEIRRIPADIVMHVISHPTKILTENEIVIYQSIVNFSTEEYLVRVFVNEMASPNVVITVYRTSKIEKYES
jgi:hypothetical protein